MAQTDWQALSIRAGMAFTPAAPVDAKALFAGRIGQLRQVVDAVNQKGQHAIVFGERGVGKTSLANIIESTLGGGSVFAPRVNCDGTDTYSSLWRKMFRQITLQRSLPGMGLGTTTTTTSGTVAEQLPDDIGPDDVVAILEALSSVLLILVIDEFDRISNARVRTAIADTIKTLSDHTIDATIVLVGVADSVDELIEEHQSIERALVQIRMPRMSTGELHEILDNGLRVLGMSMDPQAKQEIASLSKGLPHYAHLLGRHAARAAADAESLTIGMDHVRAATSNALDEAQHTTQSAYHKATMSARTDSMFREVLLACALAKTDDLGYFAAGDIRDPLSIIKGKDYNIPGFARHLSDFCGHGRGPILQKTGSPRRYRYRFFNPLMQPYIIMRGTTDGLVTQDALVRIEQAQS